MHIKSKKTIIMLVSFTVSTVFMSAAAIISYNSNAENSSPSSIIYDQKSIKET